MHETSYAHHNLLEAAGHQYVMANRCERLKNAYSDNPLLWHQYAECEFYHKYLAHHYQAMHHKASLY